MSNIRVELNSDGVQELLKSSEMQNICKGYAEDIANRSGTDSTVSVYVGRKRCNASVAVSTIEEADDLIKAVMK